MKKLDSSPLETPRALDVLAVLTERVRQLEGGAWVDRALMEQRDRVEALQGQRAEVERSRLKLETKRAQLEREAAEALARDEPINEPALEALQRQVREMSDRRARLDLAGRLAGDELARLERESAARCEEDLKDVLQQALTAMDAAFSRASSIDTLLARLHRVASVRLSGASLSVTRAGFAWVSEETYDRWRTRAVEFGLLPPHPVSDAAA